MKAVSLFASSGIGDLALEANGIEVVVANELLADRADLFAANFPSAEVIQGDVWTNVSLIVDRTRTILGTTELDFLLATPPCQGMSKNGMGKLLQGVRNGSRATLDPRNRLIIPTMDVVVALRPRVVVFENVPEMRNTIIENESGELVRILDYVAERLGDEYSGGAEVVEFADFGVPERRQRLITIYTRDASLISQLNIAGTLLPEPSHSDAFNSPRARWLTVRDTIGHLPALDAGDPTKASSDFHPLHRVPVLDEKKYRWIAATPPEMGAFDNQCSNVDCLFDKNPTHGSSKTIEGVNRASETTPLFCEACGELLPRPYTVDGNSLRIMKGFTSAYRRMKWDRPSPTLTTNLSYPSSDQNLHPDQNRVLSLFEALELHTVNDYPFEWIDRSGNRVSDKLIRESIGESVPPRGLDSIIRWLADHLTEAYSAGISAA